jgi:hypothetical protein
MDLALTAVPIAGITVVFWVLAVRQYRRIA